MWRKKLTKITAAPVTMILCLCLLVGPVRPQSGELSPAATDVRKGEVIVEIKPEAVIDSVNMRHRTTTIQRIYGTNFYRLRVPGQKSENKWRKRLSKDVDVLSASLNPVISSPISVFARSHMSFPEGFAEPGRSRSDYLSQSDLAALLQLRQSQERSTGRGIVVAVIDTGIDRTHPDLASRLWRDESTDGDVWGNMVDDDNDGLVDDTFGWDFVDSDKDPSESAGNPAETVTGHGTFIAGLIALVAPEARILPVRAFYPDGTSDAFTVAQAIKYAADHGAHVINLSFGSADAPQVMVDAIEYARQRNCVLVAAVGNDNSEGNPQYPATSPSSMAVAAIDFGSRKARFSNYGAEVDVTAPGTEIVSTYPVSSNGQPDYAVWSGTSFAAPFAAAEAALILQVASKETDPKRIIEETAFPIDELNPGFSGKLGRGRIDPLAALRRVYLATGTEGLNHTQIRLNPQSPDGGGGLARLAVMGTKQEFEVEAYGLSPRLEYRVFVNGNDLSSAVPGLLIKPTSLGGFKVELSTEPGSGFPLPQFLTPVTNARRVEVRERTGRLVLAGEFTPVSNPVKPIDQFDEKEATLASTGLLPLAGGRARVEVSSEREKFRVEAEGLEPNGIYRIAVDGVFFGTAIALTSSSDSQSAFLRAEFTSDGSSGRQLPPGSSVMSFARVEIRDSFGRAVVQGDFQAGGGVSGDGGGVGEGIRISFRGVIERLPATGLIGEWIVSGRFVHVTSATRIKQDKGPVRVGTPVEVKGTTQPNGSVAASEVEVRTNTSGGDGLTGVGSGGNGGNR